MGIGLRITELPTTYVAWQADRELHLRRDLVRSEGTDALYARYRDELGWWRYRLLRLLQGALVPEHVHRQLDLPRSERMRPLLTIHPLLVRAGLRPILRRLLVPKRYLASVRDLDRPRQARR